MGRFRAVSNADTVGGVDGVRGVFANRTLNLRSVQAIGYDMDYTLIHYRVDEWERAAFDHARRWLIEAGWPVEDLAFDPDAFTLGLVFDLDLGNLAKATRFGYVVRAQHGSTPLTFDEQRSAYAETVIDLSEDRFDFMNTMFELSRAALFTQCVDLLDADHLPGVRSYYELYRQIDAALGRAHVEGELKAEILADPERFVEPDPEIVQTLLDQRMAGRQLLLITNSDWSYTRQIMAQAIGPFCPDGSSWRDLFDIVIVSADKPRFFSDPKALYQVVDEERSLLSPHSGELEAGSVYFGGNARLVESSLGLSNAQLLYVGDHLFGDVHVTKDLLRWRTALVARELEAEIAAAGEFTDGQHTLQALMEQKRRLDFESAQLRMDRTRSRRSGQDLAREVAHRLDEINAESRSLDEQIAPLAQESSRLGNASWGPLMRAGNDKSLFARQVERYADVYMSRVSNLGRETPYAYLRAARGSLPHD